MINLIASTDLNELSILLGAVFGAFGTLLFGFYKYAEAREKDFEKSRNNQAVAFEKTISKLSVSIDASTEAHKEVALQTKRSADQAEQRNGHLAELTIEARDALIKHIDKQVVGHQTVEHQHIESKE